MGDVLCNHILDVMEVRSEHTTQPVSFKNENITWSRKVVKEMKENHQTWFLSTGRRTVLVFDFAVVNDEWVGRTARGRWRRMTEQHSSSRKKLSFSMVIPCHLKQVECRRDNREAQERA